MLSKARGIEKACSARTRFFAKQKKKLLLMNIKASRGRANFNHVFRVQTCCVQIILASATCKRFFWQRATCLSVEPRKNKLLYALESPVY